MDVVEATGVVAVEVEKEKKVDVVTTRAQKKVIIPSETTNPEATGEIN